MEPQLTTGPEPFGYGRNVAASIANCIPLLRRTLADTEHFVVTTRTNESDEQAQRLASALWMLNRARVYLRAFAHEQPPVFDTIPGDYRWFSVLFVPPAREWLTPTEADWNHGDPVMATSPAEAAERMAAQVDRDHQQFDVALDESGTTFGIVGAHDVYDVRDSADSTVTRWVVSAKAHFQYAARPTGEVAK